MFSYELFQLQMGFSFPFLRANDLSTSLLIMRTRSLLYVGIFLNLLANIVNNNDQHVRYGTNVRMSQNPHLRRKRMVTGIIIARRATIALRRGQGQAARQLHRGSDADADADAEADVPHRVLPMPVSDDPPDAILNPPAMSEPDVERPHQRPR